MTNWVRVGTDVAVGGAIGVGDQLIQNADDKRPEAGIMSQYGTYYNYGIPILAILGVAFGFLKGDWVTRGVVAGSQLAGRKVTKQVTKASAVPYTNWSRQRQLEAARQKALGTRQQVGGTYSPPGIPVIANETVLV